MRHLFFFVGLFVASSAFGQSRLYTTQTWGSRCLEWRPSAQSKPLRFLAPHQFVYVPARRLEPSAMMSRSSETAGPFGEFKPFSLPRRLDGSSLSEPPWTTTAYFKTGHGPACQLAARWCSQRGSSSGRDLRRLRVRS